ncbi:hypothetical protein CAC42_2066 [Sphaceloma murrayae]|uniref:Uncharacterized protein n=1 Tax=Sphaceloma murrayae TaxID=2082308 RepID=A0A2K1QI66_9PEZI|nr:hypothetical protein CAC42_2066 [Sphaceloma murrayae]
MASLDLIIKSTLQAVILSGISNILAQLITAYQTDRSWLIDPEPLVRFMVFSLLSCPPNVLWQSWLEHRFPGYDPVPPAPKPSSKSEKAPPAPARKLSKTNTLIKFSLDSTLGGTVNTAAFIGGMLLLRGETDMALVADRIGKELVPLMLAGQKLWPAVSLLSFTLVPLEYRTLFGGLVGVGWGIYLSLIDGKGH